MPAHEYEDLARAALLEVTPENTVGSFVGTSEEGDGVVSLLFANRMPGYPGWRWTVSVAKVGDDDPTVLEVELMPGDGSLLAPDWVPWSERLAEYRAAQEDEDGDESDDEDEDDDEDADYDDTDDDEDDDLDEDDLSESDDDDLDGVDVDELDEVDSDDDTDDTDGDTDGDDDDDVSDGASDAELAEPVRSRGARRRARRVRPSDPDDDLEVDRLDPTEVDPDHHR